MARSAELEALAAEVSNWGRWGADDELGTQNLIDDAAVLRGTRAARTGRRFSLAVPLDLHSPQVGQPLRRTNPLLTMLSVNERDPMAPGDWKGTDDQITMCTCAGTHIDALAHITYDGTMYNGHPADAITPSDGATKCGVQTIRPIVTRGILLDVAALEGVERLDGGYGITSSTLDACVERVGVEPQPGDVICVRTGNMGLHLAGRAGDRKAAREYATGNAAGLTVDSVKWFSRHDIAGVFTDTYIFEVWPPEDWNEMLAVHILHLRDMGMLQGQHWNFEDLAADCAADGVAEFLLTATPEPITGSASGIVHPVAVK